MDKSTFSNYLKLRERIGKFLSKVGFRCLRCKENCCERNIERIPLFPEDIKLMKENGLNLSGITSHSGKVYSLRRNKELNHCYYYSPEKRACGIHKHNPIYCLSYPFTFQFKAVYHLGKPLDGYNRLFFPNPFCSWVKESEPDIDPNSDHVKKIQKRINQLK